MAVSGLPFLYSDAHLGLFWDETSNILTVLLMVLAALLVMTFLIAYGALTLFALEPREIGLQLGSEYVPQTSCTLCASWCLFSFWAMVICAVAGCIVVTYTQLGGFCLVLHSELGDLLQSSGLVDSQNESLASVQRVAQMCLHTDPTPTGSSDILSSLKYGVSVRERLKDFSVESLMPPPDIDPIRRFATRQD